MAVKTKRDHENYLLIDAGAGVPESLLLSVGMDPHLARGKHELKTFTCSHCQGQIIPNPWRTRERAWCKSCDHYICDRCKAEQVLRGGACRPLKHVLNEVAEALDKGLSPDTVDLPRIILP